MNKSIRRQRDSKELLRPGTSSNKQSKTGVYRMADVKMVPEKAPGTGGEKYIPVEERTGNESIVYFTRDLSPEGLRKIYN